MRNYQLISKYLGAWPAPALLLLFQLSSAFGQLAPEVAQLGYADTIFVNGKVVSMDDKSRSTVCLQRKWDISAFKLRDRFEPMLIGLV